MAFVMEQPQDGFNRPLPVLPAQAVPGAGTTGTTQTSNCASTGSQALDLLRKERNRRAAKARLREAALDDELAAATEQE